MSDITDTNINNLKQNLMDVMNLLEKMPAREFEQSVIRAGYYPKRKRPTKSQLELEQELTYNNLDDLFHKVDEGELKEEIRKSILSMRRVAELMDMMGIDL